MNSFKKDLTAIFVENFSEDIIAYFADGYHNGPTDFGSSFIDMSDFTPTTPNEQPTEGSWMRISIDEGVVANDAITNGVIKAKRMIGFVQFDLLWHEDVSSKVIDETIEPALDLLYLNTSFRGSDGDSEIFNQQDVPKDTIITRATGNNVWSKKELIYPFVLRYLA
jgi:hypothetical protein